MRWMAMCACWWVLAACSDVAPTNPFDPSTPLGGQATGRVDGRLVLPAGFAAVQLNDAVVQLRRLDAPAEPVYSEGVDADGVFTFGVVVPTSYTVVVVAPGFEVQAPVILVEPGAAVDVGDVPLVSTADDVAALLTGTALLDGRLDGAHGGTVVEVEGTPFATVTTGAGDWQLTVNALVDATVVFRAVGYDPVRISGVNAVAGEAVGLDAVTLSGARGLIRGSVRLGGNLGLNADAVSAAFLDLLDGEDESVAQARPDETGVFIFDDVPVGQYVVAVRRDGFTSIRRAVTVMPGAAVEVGEVLLSPTSVEVRIDGIAQRVGAATHAGIRVALRGTALNTETDDAGAYTLFAPLRRADYVVDFSLAGHNAEQAVAPAPGAMAIEAALASPDASIRLTPDPAEVALSGLPGRIRGTVSLPAGFDAALVQQTSVRLSTLDAPADVVAVRAPDALGLYLFEDLPAETYRIELSLDGFITQTRQAVLGAGGDVLLDAARLSADIGSDRSFIEGVARRACGGADCDHSGIVVEVVGRPFVTVTGADGQYRLEVLAGANYTIAFSAPGYAPTQLVGIDAQADATTPAPAVELAAQSGVVRAIVRLERFQTADRLTSTSVGLYANVGDADPLQQTAPDGAGDVVLADVLPGRYQLRVARAGYVTDERLVIVEPGAEAFGGLFELVHTSQSPAAVALTGVIRLAGQEDHSGTRVQVRLSPDDLALGEAVTDAAGQFTLPAAPDERYIVSVERESFAPIEPVGPVAWADGAFRDEQAQPVARTLLRSPIDGRIRVSVAIEPMWIPARERFARVTLIGPEPRAEDPVFAGGDALEFTDLPEGEYLVQITRAGFSIAQVPVTLSQDSPTADIGELGIELQDLARAGMDLRGHTIDACDLRTGLSLVGADLAGTILTGGFGEAVGCPEGAAAGPLDLTRADLTQANLVGARFGGDDGVGATLNDASLGGADLSGVDLRGVQAVGADMFAATLNGAQFADADLRDVNFTAARLKGALFVQAQLDEDGVPLRDEEGFWPALGAPTQPWLDFPCDGDGGPGVQLSGAIFARANLDGAFMPGVRLAETDMSRATLTDADLRFTCLLGANLSLLDLSGATLDGAEATGAQFSGSLLRRTSMRGTTLSHASLVNAVLDETDMRVSPTCVEGAAWADYAPDGRCVGEAPDVDCRCRTRLDGATLDGANLVGASLGGVDLAAATLRGTTIGEAPRVSRLRPAACYPQAYYACRRFAEYRQVCPSEGRAETLDQWQAFCDATPLGDNGSHYKTPASGIELPVIECLLGHWAGGECPDETLCGDNPVVPAEPFENRCVWADISEAQGELGGQHCTYNGEIRLHSACLVAPTTLEDVRLDGAEMSGAVLDTIAISNSRALGINLSAVTFLDALIDDVDFTGADFGEANLNGLDLTGEVLVDANFTRASLQGVDLSAAVLTGAILDDADLTGAVLYVDQPPASMLGCRIEASDFIADLSNMPLAGAILRRLAINGDLTGADFQHAQLDAVTLHTPIINGESIGGFDGARFDRARLREVRITGPISGAVFSRANIDGVTLGNAPARPAASRTGYAAVAADFSLAQGRVLNLINADLTDATFEQSRIARANMRYAHLNGTTFNEADMPGSVFTGAEFTGACLRDANFTQGEFDDAVFTDTQVGFADFSHGSLVNADFTGACQPANADFNFSDLQGTRFCSTAQQVIESRFVYDGQPVWVDCQDAPACPADCR